MTVEIYKAKAGFREQQGVCVFVCLATNFDTKGAD